MNKILWIIIECFSYTARTSIGKMYFEYVKDFVHDPIVPVKEYFGYTLEDTLRPANIKVHGETAVPRGIECNVSLYSSPKFGKTIIFHTEDDHVTIKSGLLTFRYILAHGGNIHTDTEACILVARNLINKDTIQGSLQKELQIFIEQKIKEGYTIKAKFTYLPQIENSILSINLKKEIMTSQFFKGLAMTLVAVFVSAFSTVPLSWPYVTISLISAVLVYTGTNAFKPLQPISIPSTLTLRDGLAAVLILIGNGILQAGALAVIIGIDGIDWLALLKVSASIAFTYLGSTLFSGPYSTRKVDWTPKARIAYNQKVSEL